MIFLDKCKNYEKVGKQFRVKIMKKLNNNSCSLKHVCEWGQDSYKCENEHDND